MLTCLLRFLFSKYTSLLNNQQPKVEQGAWLTLKLLLIQQVCMYKKLTIN